MDQPAWHAGTFRWLPRAAAALLMLVAADRAGAKGTGQVFVSNEKSSTITVLDAEHRVVDTFPTCARPRGMIFTPDHVRFLVGCADDSVIAIYEVASRKLVGRIRETLADVATIEDHATAVERELGPQVWSVTQPAFKEKLAAMRRRITSR